MLYKPDWEKTQKKFIEYWNKENHDRPLISITGVRDNTSPKQTPLPNRLIDRWMDTNYVIKSSREKFAATFYGAEAYPDLWPNLGPDIFGAILGDDIEFGEYTSWSKHMLEDWENVKNFKFDPQNKWWQKIREMTETIVEDSKGDYFVGITDLHPGADGLVSLRGPENLCFDLFDYPDSIKKSMFELLDIFKTVIDELYNITTKYQPGSSNWLGVWHPKKWYVTSCDFMGMISENMYKEFIEEELEHELEYLDASIFHLDGPGALKHLDSLLKLPKLNGIQWCYGAGQPTASHWIPVLKKIQEAGKLIHITAEPADLDMLLQELKPEGLMIAVLPSAYDNPAAKPFTETEAKEILKKVEASYKSKLY